MNMFISWCVFFALLQPTDEYLEWNLHYNLQWHDFTGEPSAGSVGDAGAAVRIEAKPYTIRNEVFYEVRALFNRSGSWVRDSSDALLAHEQLHFDLAEVYARRIRERIEGLRAAGERDISVFNAHIRKLLEESNTVDRRYDLETLHGALSRKQEEWAKKIETELTALEEFSRKRRVISAPKKEPHPVRDGA